MYNVISNQIGYKNLLERKGRKMKESIFEKAKKARENKKGFTLVELIVVLVILAILAAILVPALLGWIDKAKEKQIVVEGRVVQMAAQTVASEQHSKETQTLSSDAAVAAMTEYIAGDASGNYAVTIASNKVTKVIYKSGDTTVVWTAADGWVKDNTQAVDAKSVAWS